MGKVEKIKWSIGILIFAVISVLLLNYTLKLSEDNLIKLIGGAMVIVPTLLSVIISNKTNNQIVYLTDDVKVLQTETSGLKLSVKELDKIVGSMDVNIDKVTEMQIAHDKGFIEISEILKHNKRITALSKKIEIITSDIIDKHYDLNSFLQGFLIQTNTNISLVISSQYEYGFDDFNLTYFKKKLYNELNLLSEHANFHLINKDVFDIILNSIKKNIELYLNELKLLKHLENGTRRDAFEKQTIIFIQKIVNHSIEIYQNNKLTA